MFEYIIRWDLAGGATFVHYAEELFKPPYRNLINLKLAVYDHNKKKLKKI